MTMLTVTLPPPTLSPTQYDWLNSYRQTERISWGDALRQAIDFGKLNPPESGPGWEHFKERGKHAPTFLVDPETAAWLEGFCIEHDVTRSAAIRACVGAFMASRTFEAVMEVKPELVTIQE